MSRKLKSILTASLLVMSLASASLPVPSVSAATTELIETGYAVAEANGINLDSNADAAELAVLNKINCGVLPQIDFEDGSTVSYINGLISNLEVHSKRDAKRVIASIANLLGINDPDSELTFCKTEETEFSTAYIFRQTYHGIGFENSFVTLNVNKSTGKADYLNSSFVPDVALETVPEITAGQVRSIVRAAYDTGLSEDAELVIFKEEDGTLKLAYEAKTLSSEYPTVFVDAINGSILYAVDSNQGDRSTYTYKKSVKNPITGLKEFTVNTESYVYHGSTYYRLHDAERNIFMVSNPSGFTTKADNRSTEFYTRTVVNNDDYWKPEKLLCQRRLSTVNESYIRDYIIRQMESNSWTNSDKEIGVYYQVSKAFDFYANALHRNGTDGVNGRLFVNPYLNAENAYANNFYNYIQFGNENRNYYNWAKEIEIVVHEYTHRVSNCIVGWGDSSQKGQTGSVNEGYSDIMGAYASGYYDYDIDWVNGNDISKRGHYLRDASVHNRDYYRQYFSLYDENGKLGTYYTDHYYRIDAVDNINTVECHEGATILSHVAYLMDTYNIRRDYAREMWYNSLNYLAKGRNQATFLNCRRAVERAALDIVNKYYKNSPVGAQNYLVMVASAFNYPRIYDGSYRLGDINQNGRLDSGDVTLVKRYANDHSVLSSPNQISLGDVDFDGYLTQNDANLIQRAINNGTII